MFKIKFTDEQGGWYLYETDINTFIYDRVSSESEAQEYDEDTAVNIIIEANDLGYDCKAVPPITRVY